MQLRVYERAFDVEGYLRHYDSEAKHYGANLAVRCSKCGKAQKLWVLVCDKADGTKAGSFICYFCGQGGKSVLSLIKWVEDCDAFKAVEILLTHQTGGKPTSDLRALVMQTLDGVSKLEETWDEAPITPIPLPSEFISCQEDAPPPYFKERGISIKKALRYNIGWCEEGYYKNRMIVPVTVNAQQVFFVARYMGKPPLGVRKVLYPKGAKVGRVLFNYDRAKLGERIVIVEGVLDAIAVGKDAVATFGTSLSQYQLDLLMRTAASEIVISYDNDAIGKAKALAVRLSEYWSVRCLELDQRDPDEYPRGEFQKLIEMSPLMDAGEAWKQNIVSRLV